MFVEEPSRLQILAYHIAGAMVPSIWSDWVNRMGLRGHEWVLEFGVGAGIGAAVIARKLSRRGGRLTCTDVSSVWQTEARHRLRRYTNTEFRLGDIDTLGLPNAAYDVINVHMVLHEIPTHDRVRVLVTLQNKLKPDGRLFLREPLGESNHTISEDEIRWCAREAALYLSQSRIARVPLLGLVFEGVFAGAVSGPSDRKESDDAI